MKVLFLMFCLIVSLEFFLNVVKSQRSGCFNEKQYELTTESTSFEIGLSTCEDLGGITAQINTIIDLEFIFDNLETENVSFFIGLKRSSESNGLDPKSFAYLDGTFLSNEFGGFRGNDPWFPDQPDNFVNEFCVEARSRLWNDISCSKSRLTLCQFSCTSRIECLNNKTYKTTAGVSNFDTSVTACERKGGVLAQPKNIEDANFVNQILKDLGQSFWLGIDRDPISDGEDPTNFNFLDGTSLSEEFGGSKDEFPWLPNQPDNTNEIEFCIEALFTVAPVAFWNDRKCDEARLGLCDNPTLSPTSKPTKSPTESQASPTITTYAPTVSPTGKTYILLEEESGFTKKYIFLALASISLCCFLLTIMLLITLWRKLSKILTV